MLVYHLTEDFCEFLSGEAENLTLSTKFKLHLPQVSHESVFQVRDITSFKAQIVYDVT